MTASQRASLRSNDIPKASETSISDKHVQSQTLQNVARRVTIHIYNNAKDWRHVLEMDYTCLENGDVDLREIAQTLKADTGKRCRVSAPYTSLTQVNEPH